MSVIPPELISMVWAAVAVAIVVGAIWTAIVVHEKNRMRAEREQRKAEIQAINQETRRKQRRR